MDAVYDANDQCFHFVLIDTRDLVPWNFPALSIKHLDVRIIAGFCDGCDARMKLFQITTTDTCGGHGDSDNTPFAFQLNFFVPHFCRFTQTVDGNVGKTQINPKKLRLSKWTAVNPQENEKHFLVTKVIDPEQPKHLIELVVMEAVLTKRSLTMKWTELTDATKWVQGWV